MKLSLFLFVFLLIADSINSQSYEDMTVRYDIGHVSYDPNQVSGGVAIIDFNNDGYEDIYFTGGLYMDHLYMNINGEGFQDVTTQTSINILRDRYTMGVVAGDVDNDGFTDLIITTGPEDHTILMRNINGERFEDYSAIAGLESNIWSTSPTLADPDMDGDLDLYVSNYLSYDGEPFFLNITFALANMYYQNNGDGTFKLKQSIINDTDKGCTLVSNFTDVDQDGDVDLFVLNDFGDRFGRNQLYINDDSGTMYTERSMEFNTNSAINSMGISAGDVFGDGRLGYYISNTGTNIFYAPSGNFTFEDKAESLNINEGEGVSWGSFFTDINNDTYVDLFLAKGTLAGSFIAERNRLFLFDPESSTFNNIAQDLLLDDPHKGRGAVYADINNDGLQDIIISNLRIRENNMGDARVYLNTTQTDNNYLQLKLTGDQSNKSAYGAFIELYIDDKKWIRELNGGSSFQSHNSAVIHYGLGEHEKVDSVIINWPGTKRQTLKDLQINSYYTITESQEPVLFTQAVSTSVGNSVFAENNPLIKVIPNPADDMINIRLDEQYSYDIDEFQIMDINGRVLHKQTHWAPHKLAIDITGYPEGLYILSLLSNGRWDVTKFVIQR